jgi:hypothetical protein
MNYFRGQNQNQVPQTSQQPEQNGRQDVNGNQQQPKTAAPIDQEQLMALLSRFNIVENPGAVSDQNPPARWTASKILRGYREPVQGTSDQFIFRANLRGALGSLNNLPISNSETFELPLSAFIDPVILQYYQFGGAYQFQISNFVCSLQFVPNADTSGVIFTTIIAQSPDRVVLTSNFTSEEHFSLNPGLDAYPIDQDLSAIFATFDVETHDAKLMSPGNANAAGWLTVSATVKFDGFVPPVVDQKNIERKKTPTPVQPGKLSHSQISSV